MDIANTIIHTHELRREFIQHARKNLGKNVKDETVKKAFGKLVKAELLINYDEKSVFTVNPQHVYRNSEDSRRKLINALIYEMIRINSTKSNFMKALGIK
jgi:DNA-binding transcriptional regulator YhcF (GntR family)